MFAYNPAVTDRSAEILTAANNQAAAIQLQGMQNFSQGIGNAMQSLGDGYAKARDNAAKLETSMAAGQAMMNLSQQYGAEGEMFRESFAKSLQDAGKNPDKIAGVTAAHTSYFDALMAKDKMNAQIAGYKDLADYKAANAPASTTTAPRMNSENIRSMVAEAKAAGFTDDAIKAKLQSQFGDWAVRSVYPPQNQGIWMGQ